jgi:hypothetical protein
MVWRQLRLPSPHIGIGLCCFRVELVPSLPCVLQNRSHPVFLGTECVKVGGHDDVLHCTQPNGVGLAPWPSLQDDLEVSTFHDTRRMRARGWTQRSTTAEVDRTQRQLGKCGRAQRTDDIQAQLVFSGSLSSRSFQHARGAIQLQPTYKPEKPVLLSLGATYITAESRANVKDRFILH